MRRSTSTSGDPRALIPTRLPPGSFAAGGVAIASTSTARSQSCCQVSATDSLGTAPGCNDGLDPAPVGANANHLGLTVLVAGQRWLVDVGLGDALYEPIPLEWGTYPQGPYAYTLRPSEYADAF